MDIITQKTIFDYMEIEILGDLERLQLVLEGILDTKSFWKLINTLNKERGNGRNDNPNLVMFKIYVAMKVYEHRGYSSIRRELMRNSDLRKMIGLIDGEYLFGGKKLVPTKGAWTGFSKNLMKHQDLVDDIFEENVNFMYENVESFGEETALDGKIIHSFAKGNNKKTKADGRRDIDADWFCKEQSYIDAKGETKKKKTSYFGYEAHILCDVKTELPIAYELEKASISEVLMAHKILDELSPKKLLVMNYSYLDGGYDDIKLIQKYKSNNIIPLIDIRNMWKDGEKTKQYKNTNLVYTYEGEIFYVHENGSYERLKYKGYDKEREALRYSHKIKGKIRVYRIEIKYDERIFLPVARDSKKYQKLYAKRTSVERLNGRIDRDYLFNDHFIRSKKKMKLSLSITFIIMLSMAKGHIKKKQSNLASLVNI